MDSVVRYLTIVGRTSAQWQIRPASGDAIHDAAKEAYRSFEELADINRAVLSEKSHVPPFWEYLAG